MFIRNLARTRRGSSSVEYGLLIAVIMLGALVTIAQVADLTTGFWFDIYRRVTSASNTH